jgi:hypothetical protein
MLPTLGANHRYGQLAQATWFVRGGGLWSGEAVQNMGASQGGGSLSWRSV